LFTLLPKPFHPLQVR